MQIHIAYYFFICLFCQHTLRRNPKHFFNDRSLSMMPFRKRQGNPVLDCVDTSKGGLRL